MARCTRLSSRPTCLCVIWTCCWLLNNWLGYNIDGLNAATSLELVAESSMCVLLQFYWNRDFTRVCRWESVLVVTSIHWPCSDHCVPAFVMWTHLDPHVRGACTAPQWLEPHGPPIGPWVRAPDLWSKGRRFTRSSGRSGGTVFFYRVNFLCWLLFRYSYFGIHNST